MKLLRVIVEGQLYLAAIVAIFGAELALLFWGLWSRRPIIGLIAVFVIVPLLRSTAGAIRACFFRIGPPEGLPLARSEGGALHDLVDHIGRTLHAPPLDGIIITPGTNASLAVYTRALHRHRVLVLGFPVLATLSVAELRAVIAHELAHLSRAYDPFAGWVYRTRRNWFAVRDALDRRLATPIYVYWFIRWYVPRLDAASGEMSRRLELAADRVAAEIAGSRATADALVTIESAALFCDETYWPAIAVSHESSAEPPRPYSGMLAWGARTMSQDDLVELVARDSESRDTHPSLRERLDALGEAARTSPAIIHSSGQELLGAAFETLASALDREWLARHGESWQRRRNEFVERRAALDRLAAIDTPTVDELFAHAELIEGLEGTDAALPLYQSAAEHGHAAASLAAGRLLLQGMDASGIALVERAMDGDDSLVPEGCRVLIEYYDGTHQQLAAHRCERRATRHATRAYLAQREQ